MELVAPQCVGSSGSELELASLALAGEGSLPLSRQEALANLLESVNLYLSSTWEMFGNYFFRSFFCPILFLVSVLDSARAYQVCVSPQPLFILFSIVFLSDLQTGYFLLICFRLPDSVFCHLRSSAWPFYC